MVDAESDSLVARGAMQRVTYVAEAMDHNSDEVDLFSSKSKAGDSNVDMEHNSEDDDLFFNSGSESEVGDKAEIHNTSILIALKDTGALIDALHY